ncbi:MAG: sterol desaturase family protein [Cyclobacteriaceae bacterium]|nr:sterol desaturase family protein [Cyclobacteriaceae bacterium]
MNFYLIGTKSFWAILTVVFLRYLILASAAFLIFYVIKRHAWQFRKIQSRFPLSKDYVREIIYSILTSFIFAGVGFAVFLTPLASYTQVYYKVSDYGWGYLAASVILIIFLHDTYFYWMHRLIHHKSVYKYVHRVHHLSTNPSPWAAMAFHPLEAVLEAGIIVLVAFLFPVHPLAIGIFLLFMMIYNVYGHLGYELYPKGFAKSLVGRWINTSVNHNMHHQYFKGNYGLYFLFWDRWLGTLHPDYDEQFQVAASKQKP